MEYTPDFKEFTHTLFTLKGLSDDLSQEKETIVTSASQMAYASKEFKKYSERFDEQIEQSRSHIESIISREIRSVAKSITEEVSQNLIKVLSFKSEEAANKLQQTSNQCEHNLSSSVKKISVFSKWFMSVVVASAVVGGLIGGAIIHYLPPRYDEKTKEKINAGELLEAAWPQLDRKEKDKILELHKNRTTKQ